MHHGTDLMLGHYAIYQGRVADVALYEMNAPRLLQRRKTGAIPRVGEGIQHHEGILGVCLGPVINKVHANKARATRYQQRLRHCVIPPCSARDPSMSLRAARHGRCTKPNISAV